jgi:hypothetical protein
VYGGRLTIKFQIIAPRSSKHCLKINENDVSLAARRAKQRGATHLIFEAIGRANALTRLRIAEGEREREAGLSSTPATEAGSGYRFPRL